uniref:ZF-HD dimerization-type domain-containing protein n=1 Tax=Solanum lycopersicum TaxID=4081 RepID=A0A3Q7I266_SOLLC
MPNGGMTIKYGTCLKNHATKFGYYSVDGCREFVNKGDDGTKEESICANCDSRFIHPHVIPHGGGNAPIIYHPFTTRVMPVQYIRCVFYYYPSYDKSSMVI